MKILGREVGAKKVGSESLNPRPAIERELGPARAAASLAARSEFMHQFMVKNGNFSLHQKRNYFLLKHFGRGNFAKTSSAFCTEV